MSPPVLLDNFEGNKTEYIKKNSLTSFGDENIWQHFFENNKWIFGIGIEMRCLILVGGKLEIPIVGSNYNTDGRRTDAFMRTNAIISQSVLIEIKPSTSTLVTKDTNHAGCFFPSENLMIGVTQIQKTARDYINKIKGDVKEELKDKNGKNTKDYLYHCQPRTYLVIGKLKDLDEHDDKITCFEIFRRNLHTPEIITYDELYERAKFIVYEGSQKKTKPENQEELILS